MPSSTPTLTASATTRASRRSSATRRSGSASRKPRPRLKQLRQKPLPPVLGLFRARVIEQVHDPVRFALATREHRALALQAELGEIIEERFVLESTLGPALRQLGIIILRRRP